MSQNNNNTIQDKLKKLIENFRKDRFMFFEKNLKIRPKKGGMVPLILNDAQKVLDQAAEEMLAEHGKVRIILVKARQEGGSTYIGARIYWKVSLNFGLRAIIITHLGSATKSLFGMAKRFYTNSLPFLKPKTASNSQKELLFSKLDSGYGVATARNEESGRSETVQYLHASEVAFWDNGEEIMKGLAQTVPDMDDTEVWLESTAKGLNFFYEMWRAAVAGLSEYKPVFLPWYIQEEYRRKVPEDFKLSQEDQEYMETFDLDLEQMAWRANKINSDFKGCIDDFNQEYPATPDMAFIRVNEKALINTLSVQKARKKKPHEVYRAGPHVVGLDVARFGDDRTAFIHRQGRVAFEPEVYSKLSIDAIADIAARILNEDRTIRMMYIDTGGLGAGVYDILVRQGYARRVRSIAFNSTASDPRKYFNKRSEMWGELAEWLHDDITPSIPDRDDLHSDLTAPTYIYNHNDQLKLDPKDKIKKEMGASPDLGDALALTFAENLSFQDEHTPDWLNSIDYGEDSYMTS